MWPKALPLLALLAVSACGDRGGGEAGAAPEAASHGVLESDSAWKVDAQVGPPVTPAESARAARAVDRYTDSVRAAALRQAGLPPAARRDPAPPPPSDDSPRARYESCMTQARAAPEHARAAIIAACENIRRQPDYPD